MLTVKCGHCKDCIKAMQDDWFVRAFFEFKRIEGKGLCFFPTLTFDNDHLPYWTDGEMSFPCFDLTLIKRFRDKLRVYLTRDGYDAKGIRYIVCPEFGGKKGRPHYHVLLFVPFKITVSAMKSYLKKAWTNGLVMYSPEYGAVVTSDRGTQYVMKYVSKPSGWYAKYGIGPYTDSLKQAIADERDPFLKEEKREHLREFRRHCPRHTQSTYFGIQGIEYFKNPDGSWNMDKLVKGSINLASFGATPDSKKPKFQYNLPEYYARKIFYQQDQWKLYQRNALAHEVFALRWELARQRKIERLVPYFTTDCLLHSHIGFLPGIDETESKIIFQSLQNALGDRTLNDLVLYDMVYRGLQMDEAFVGMSMQELHDNALDYIIAQRSVDIEPAPELPKYERYRYSANSVEFSQHPCFEQFENILKQIDDFEHHIGELTQVAYQKETERQLALHDIVSPYKFYEV